MKIGIVSIVLVKADEVTCVYIDGGKSDAALITIWELTQSLIKEIECWPIVKAAMFFETA